MLADYIEPELIYHGFQAYSKDFFFFFNLCITASAEKKRNKCIAVTLVNKACKICNSKYQYEKYLHVGGLLLNPNWSVVGSKPSLRDFDLLSLTVLYVKVNSFVTWHISSYSILKETEDNLVSVIPPDVAGQSHWNNVPFYYGNDLICWRGRFEDDIYILYQILYDVSLYLHKRVYMLIVLLFIFFGFLIWRNVGFSWSPSKDFLSVLASVCALCHERLLYCIVRMSFHQFYFTFLTAFNSGFLRFLFNTEEYVIFFSLKYFVLHIFFLH